MSSLNMATPGNSAKPPYLCFAELNALFQRAAQLGGKAGAGSQGLPRAPSILLPVFSEESLNSGCRELQESCWVSGSPMLVFLRIMENSFRQLLPGPKPQRAATQLIWGDAYVFAFVKGSLIMSVLLA